MIIRVKRFRRLGGSYGHSRREVGDYSQGITVPTDWLKEDIKDVRVKTLPTKLFDGWDRIKQVFDGGLCDCSFDTCKGYKPYGCTKINAIFGLKSIPKDTIWLKMIPKYFLSFMRCTAQSLTAGDIVFPRSLFAVGCIDKLDRFTSVVITDFSTEIMDDNGKITNSFISPLWEKGT